MWMYLQWLPSERIKKSIKQYSHFCHLYIEKQTGFFYHVCKYMNVKSREVLWPWELQLVQVISTFFGLNDSISFVYWGCHCVREATFFRGSFPLHQRAYWLTLEIKLQVWTKNVKHAEMTKHKQATTTLRGTWADLRHLFYRHSATSKNNKFKNNYITATCGSWLEVLVILTSFTQRQRRAL